MSADLSHQRELHFRKYEAIGNDYLVVDAQHYPLLPNPSLVRRICDRRSGVGADGILYGPFVEPAGFRLRIFNPDGSEAEKSGNGIRIFARYLRDAGYVSGPGHTIVTVGGVSAFSYLDPEGSRIQIGMGAATFESRKIPVAGPEREVVNEPLEIDGRELRVTCLSIGNPHCVVRFEKATEREVRRWGPLIEGHAMFPNRTNVQFLEVLDQARLGIKIWERGAGYTLASGSSSCGAAAAARRLGMVGDHVCVEMPGGVLEVDFGTDGKIMLTGDVRPTFQGSMSADFIAGL